MVSGLKQGTIGSPDGIFVWGSMMALGSLEGNNKKIPVWFPEKLPSSCEFEDDMNKDFHRRFCIER